MEGERILKSLLNGETDGLYEDTKSYLSPLQLPPKTKNGLKGNKNTEETISKYTLFCAKFLRCAVETLKKVKGKGNNIDEITNSLKLVSSSLYNTLAAHNGHYLKVIQSLDQLGKTIYLIVVQLIGKEQFDYALSHASDLLNFIQLVKTWKNYDSEKMDKEFATLSLRASDALLQGAGKLEEIKVTLAQRPLHLCSVLDWRKLYLLFQAEALLHSSLKSLVEKTLKCGTKYQVDCGQKNINFEYLASFFESIFNVVISKTEWLMQGGKDSLYFLVELGFHYGRICGKAGKSVQALTVFDKMLGISQSTGHCKNGHTKAQFPSQVCCCVCFLCKAAISLNCTNAKYQIENSNEQSLVECNRLLNQVLKCKTLSSMSLKLISDALEYFRVSLQSAHNKGADSTCTNQKKKKVPILSRRTFSETTGLMQSYVTVLSLQCERLKDDISKLNYDSSMHLKQQLKKIKDKQLGILSFIISSFQDQLKLNDQSIENCNSDLRCHIKDCHQVAEKASDLIHSALDDPDITLSENELRWLGCNVYNLGCVCYQRDCFLEGVPLLTIACNELKVWCFASKTEEEILERIKEVKLLTKLSLLIDCQRRARQLSDALRTATEQVWISVKSGSDVCTLRQQIKQWSTVKHELLKNLQGQEKQVERSRTLCAALANLEDAEDIVSDQLCLVLQEELVCYKEKSYDTVVEQIAVIKQLMELYIVEEEEFEYGSSMLELAVALSYHGELVEDSNKSALDVCHEAVTIIEQVLDKMDFADKDECYSSIVKDRLAVAYLWQALLEHRFAMEGKQLEESVELSESFDANELDGIYLEQNFVSSLLSSLETWVELIERLIPKNKERKINLQHFYNPEESFHYLLIAACLLGLVNQPVKKVYALHLASILSQAIGNTSVLENGATALCEAVHTMCEVLAIHHAGSLLHFASKMLDNLESCGLVKVQFLLAKSHFLLLSGKYSEGEDCLREVQKSNILMLKSYKSHLLKARFQSLCAMYSVLPAKHHIFTLIVDPVLGSLTPLECAMDGFHKLSRMAEEVFGENIFSTSKKKEIQKEREQGEGPVVLSNSTQSVFHLSLLDNLLSSLLHVGQLYSHQGAVREAFRQFIDGLALARHFCLSYRIADFLVNIAQLELKQGKREKCQRRLEQLKGILQAALRTSSDVELSNESVEEPLFIGHPESCQCASCNDPVLHVIIVKYCTFFSQYMTCVSGPEQSMTVLDLADSVCSRAQSKMSRYLDGLGEHLHLCYEGDPGSGEKKLNEKQKKGKSKCAKSKNREGDDGFVKTSSFCMMFCQHELILQCMKAEHWLCNGKVENANSELSKAMETFACVENAIGVTPVCFIPLKASFLYFSGVTVLLLNKGDSRNRFTGCSRSAKHPTMHLSIEDNATKSNSLKVDSVEEEIEKPRRGSSRRGRNSKAAEETRYGKKSRSPSSRTRGRGRRKKVEQSVIECDDSTESIVQKPKGKKKGTKSTTEVEDVGVDKTAPMWFDQVIGYWKEAFDLCIAFPPSPLFSDICKGLAFSLARTAPGHAMYYLNWSMSITLRHQALTSSGKRIKRITKDAGVFPLVQELGKEITHITDELSSLSLDTNIAPEVTCKLDAPVKVRSIMKFKSFSLEEVALLQKIPKDWTVCTLESFEPQGVEERELVICRMRASCEPVLVKINTTTGEDKLKENESADIVMDLTKLFQCNLMEEFGNIMSNSVRSMSVESTSEWWAKRTRLDSKMKDFLEKLEAAWLGKWKGVLLGQPVDKDCQDSVIAIAREMQSRILRLYGFEPDMQLLEILVSSLPYLSQQEIREALAEISGIDPVSPHLNQLLDEFGDFSSSMLSHDEQGNDMKRLRSKLDTVSRHPVILILGKDIQQLPWESIPILYDQPVTRVPSLHFLLAKISCETQLSEVNPERTFYSLNPQNNLPNTQKMFQKWFESENGWVGITGQAPSQKEFKKALTDYDLFIYFGHGTGREFLQGDDIQRLDCSAVTLLMGCSSGKLMVEGKCEPRGMVLNYLLAGCPAIVANLWDVTDKDIDRFSDLLLKQWLDSDAQLSLPEALCQSRQACKLKYLIGASPVLYGLPIHVKQ